MGPVRLEPITWERLGDLLADRLLLLKPGDGGAWPRIAFDGAPAARPGDLARRVSEALRLRGRPSLVVGAEGFWRPASVRLEHGHRDPESYYDGWVDTGALWREVFGPLEPDGDGRVLPDLWDPVTDRATRSSPVQLPPGGLLLLHGPFLLRHWFPFDLTVHVLLSPGALRRRTPEPEHWTLPAFERYGRETEPGAVADVLIRADDPRHPAWNG
ncbi:nucleoside/nucleotide kinase family protein [Streptomyces nodosus]|uniref:Uridine kinase n=1 Tax=Streptomyces nodosus TaxID=40318 RepID=A0A0B5DGB4_9ACTN|nr:uridine kinase [Streptomyces nodosus]AJE40190.1 uridine kinase [Streptomyces nodosus]QEV43177.1 uridine kinase [Streptomyces nodosus]